MGLWALWGNIMNMCVTTVAVAWLSFAVKGFWAVWENNITVVMAVLLREACYVHVLIYNTTQHSYYNLERQIIFESSLC
jgi:threonyl-tRNA synthetase